MKQRIALAIGLSAGMVFSASARAASPGLPQGQELYTTMCSTCHGTYGRGDGPALQYLDVHPPDFTEPTFFGDRSDDAVVKGLLEKGKHPETAHSPMVMAGVVKESALRDAVHYARSLGAPGAHASLLAGHDVYVSICWTCHGIDGNGKGPAAANLGTRPRDFTSPEFKIAGREDEVYKTIALGADKSFHGSQAMVAWKGALSDQQIKDVMAYIEMLKRKAGSPG
jgi:mono/diheme cytochrome c family protein